MSLAKAADQTTSSGAFLTELKKGTCMGRIVRVKASVSDKLRIPPRHGCPSRSRRTYVSPPSQDHLRLPWRSRRAMSRTVERPAITSLQASSVSASANQTPCTARRKET